MGFELITSLLAHAHTQGMNISHMIVSSLIHGLTYAALFKIFHNVSPLMAGVMAAAGIGALWFIFGRK